MNKKEIIRTLSPFAKLLREWIEDGDTPPIKKDQKYLTIPIAIADLERAQTLLSKLVKK